METDETDRFFFSTAVRLFGVAWRGCRKSYCMMGSRKKKKKKRASAEGEGRRKSERSSVVRDDAVLHIKKLAGGADPQQSS